MNRDSGSRIRRCRFSVVLFVALLSVACDELVTDFEYSSVTVEAIRRNGEPVEGLEFLLYTGVRAMEYGTTDASGRYTFEFVPFGNYGVSTLLPPELSSLEGERFVYA